MTLEEIVSWGLTLALKVFLENLVHVPYYRLGIKKSV